MSAENYQHTDVNTGYGDNQGYMRHENDYMSVHPVGNPNVKSGFHPSAIHQHLANDYGGVRTPQLVRTDIRHGLNMLKASGRTQHGGLLTAEDLGHAARQHLYVAEQKKRQGK